MKVLTLISMFSIAAAATESSIGDISSYNRQTGQKGVRIWAPKDITAIQAIVNDARQAGRKLKVKAASHSTASLILGDGDYLSTENLTGIIAIENQTVKVKAGTKLGALAEELAKKGFSLGFAYPAFRDLTIGGLLATGAHGSSRKHIGVSSQNLIAITLIDGLGNVRTLTAKDKDAFRAAQVHLGLMGVVHDVTLKIYPDFNLQYRFEQIPEFLNAKGEALFGAEADSEIVMWSPVTNKAVKYAGSITKQPANPKATNHLLDESPTSNPMVEAMTAKALGAGQMSTTINATIEAQRLKQVYDTPFIAQDPSVTDAKVSYVGTSAQLTLAEFYTPKQAFKHMEIEFGFPLSEANAVLATAREIAVRENLHFPISRGLFMRFGKSAGAQGPLMSHAERTGAPSEVWVFMSIVDFLTNDQTPHGDWSKSRDKFIQELTQKHRLLLHWGKNTDEMFAWFNPKRALGGNLEAFRKQVKAFDPQGIFANDFARNLGLTSTQTQ